MELKLIQFPLWHVPQLLVINTLLPKFLVLLLVLSLSVWHFVSLLSLQIPIMSILYLLPCAMGGGYDGDVT